MMSQMNAVQNAARLAMDHRAAKPARRRGPARSNAAVAGFVAASGLILLLALLFHAAV